MSIEIESEDVIRLIIHFLKEQGLNESAASLEDETRVSLNTVNSKDQFMKEIINGQWDVVLNRVKQLQIAHRHLIDLYEQVVLELIEMGEQRAARTLLRQTEAMQILKQQDLDRYVHLEQILSRSVYDSKEVYPPGVTKEKRRQTVAHALANQVNVIAPHRLRTLLEESAQWQQQQGLLEPEHDFDVFGDATAVQKADADHFAKTNYGTIKFPGKDTYAESVAFSPNGQYFVTGSLDGFIEIWNHLTGKLRKDLSYQAENNLMAMNNSVISLSFSHDNELLVSGSTDGKIAIWKVQAGVCQRKFSPAHSQGVNSVCFSKDRKHILSGSYDNTAKIHNVQSGKLVHTFEGHSSFINSVMYSNDESQIWSASHDGTIKIWDVTSATCTQTINPASDPSKKLPVHSLIKIPSQTTVVCCNKSNALSILSCDGKLEKTLQSPSSSGLDFIAAAVSPQGELVYAIAEDATLYCFHVSTGNLEGTVKLSQHELIGIATHPLSNVVVCNDDHGRVYLLK